MSWSSNPNANRFQNIYLKGFLDMSGGNVNLRNGSLINNGTTILNNSLNSYSYDNEKFNTIFGSTWVNMNMEFPSISRQSVAISATGQYQVVVQKTGNIFLSSNYGSINTWSDTGRNTGDTTTFQQIAISKTGKYVTAITFPLTAYSDTGYIYVSTNYGYSFLKLSISFNGFPQSVAMSYDGKYQTIVTRNTNDNNGFIYNSSNYGATWSSSTGNTNGYQSVAVSGTGQYQVAISNGSGSIYITNNYGQSWNSISQTVNNSLATTGITTSELCKTVAISYDGKYQTTFNLSFGGNLLINSNYGSIPWTDTGIKPPLGSNGCFTTIEMSSTGQYQILGSFVAFSQLTNGSISISNNYGKPGSWNTIANSSIIPTITNNYNYFNSIAISATGNYITGTVKYNNYINPNSTFISGNVYSSIIPSSVSNVISVNTFGSSIYGNVFSHPLSITVPNSVNSGLFLGYDIGANAGYINSLNTIGTMNLCLQSQGGYIGIGNVFPQYSLDISGSVNISDTLFPNLISMGRSNISYINNSVYSGISSGLSVTSDNIILKPTRDAIIDTVGNISLQPSGGKIGIGKLNASVALDISGSVNISDTLYPNLISMGSSNVSYTNNSGYNGFSSGLSVTSDNIILKPTRAAIIDTVGNISLQPSGGKIGIGKLNASVALDISGSVNISDTLFPNLISMGSSNVSYTNNSGYNGFSSGLSVTSDNIILKPTRAAIIESSGIFLQPSGGKIGIGKLNAFAALDISGSVNITNNNGNALTINGNNLQIYGSGIGINLDTSAGRIIPSSQILAIDISSNTTDIIFKTAPFSQNSQIINSERMRISNNGSIGIGTSIPSSAYKLDISGTLRINESIGSGGISNSTNGSIVLQHLNTGGSSSILFNNPSISNNSYASISYYDNTTSSSAYPNYISYQSSVLAIDLSGSSSLYNNASLRTNGFFIIDNGAYNSWFRSGIIIGTNGLNITSTTNGIRNSSLLDVYGTINSNNIISSTATIGATPVIPGINIISGNISGTSANFISGLSINSPNIFGTTISSTTINATTINVASLVISSIVSPLISATSTNDSSSVSTGAITTNGGIGCSKSIFVGGTINGNISSNSITINRGGNITALGSSIISSNFQCVSGGLFSSNALTISNSGVITNVGYDLSINSILNAGIVNINKECNFTSGSIVNIQNTTTPTEDGDTGALNITGGIYVEKNIFVNTGSVFAGGFITSNNEMTTRGGLSVYGTCNIHSGMTLYGQNNVFSCAGIITTAAAYDSIGRDSNNNLTGSLQVTGGASITGNVYIDQNNFVIGNITSCKEITARNGILVTGGNVGIGTMNPSCRLDISGSLDVNSIVFSKTNISIGINAIGINAIGSSIVNGRDNIGIGKNTLSNLLNGNNNVSLGYNSNQYYFSNNNTCIGSETDIIPTFQSIKYFNGNNIFQISQNNSAISRTGIYRVYLSYDISGCNLNLSSNSGDSFSIPQRIVTTGKCTVAMSTSGKSIIFGTGSNVIRSNYRSTNYGISGSWIEVSGNSLDISSNYSFITDTSYVLAYNPANNINSIYQSSNNGMSYTKLAVFSGKYISSSESGSSILTGANSVSNTNSYLNSTGINSFISSTFFTTTPNKIYNGVVCGTGQYMVGSNGSKIIVSSTYGVLWNAIDISASVTNYFSISYSGQFMIMLTASSLYYSLNYGSTWLLHTITFSVTSISPSISDTGNIILMDNSGSFYNYYLGVTNSTAIGYGAKVYINNQIVIGTNNEKVYIPGTVGIGTMNPITPLDVKGVIRVFNDTYDLMGLFSPDYGNYLHIGAWNNAGSSSKNIVLNLFGGNVGIGTATPDVRLRVQGSSGTLLKLVNNTTAYTGGKSDIEFWNNSNFNLAKISALDLQPTPTAVYKSGLALQVGWNGSFLEGMRLVAMSPTQVNVGIGTTNPTELLDVNSGCIRVVPNGQNVPGFITEIFGTGYNSKLYIIPCLGAGAYNGLTSPGDVGIFWGVINSNANGNFIIAPHSNSAYGIKISPTGNVGIGSGNPSKKLDVNGDALINGLTVGRGSGDSNYNAVLGSNALFSNTTGINNVAVGNNSLYNNRVGNYNVAVGPGALQNNTVSNNTAVGHLALYENTTGSENVAIGLEAMRRNTTGVNNTGVGRLSLTNNTTGNSNSGFGLNALYANTVGHSNTALGTSALEQNISGNENTAVGISSLMQNKGAANTAIGKASLYGNTTGYENVAVGVNALYSNADGAYNVALGTGALQYNTGISGTSQGSYNIAMGHKALFANTTGYGNVAMGHIALQNNTTSNGNTAIGYRALNVTTAASNTALGNSTLFYNTTGTKNTAIGDFAFSQRSDVTSISYSTAIGYNSQPTANNQIMLGTTAETVICPNKLGVGTTNPSTTLTVAGALTVQNAGGTVGSAISTSNGNFLTIEAFVSTNTATKYPVCLAAYGGNVGIGMTTPGYTLDVTGTGNFSGVLRSYSLTATTGGVTVTGGGINVTSGGITVTGGLTSRNGIYISHDQVIHGTNSAGSTESFIWPRASDNTSYINYGSGGFNIRNNGSGNTMFMTNDNKVGIGTTSPVYSLDVRGNIISNNWVRVRGNDGLYFESWGGGWFMSDVTWIRAYNDKNIYTPGQMLAGSMQAGTFNATSDYRIKNNVQRLESNKTIDLLNPVEYDLSGGKHDMGFVAHEVQEIFPFLVTGEKDGKDMQSINYNGFIALLVKEVQDLKKENKDLREKNKEMNEKNESFELRLRLIESLLLPK